MTIAAVVADLAHRGVTRPGRIAAEGGSNGALLIKMRAISGTVRRSVQYHPADRHAPLHPVAGLSELDHSAVTVGYGKNNAEVPKFAALGMTSSAGRSVRRIMPKEEDSRRTPHNP
jgi:hypothetical protein